MFSATRSLQVWAIYTFVLGTALLFVPNALLGLFQIEETSEVWIRVLGVSVLVLTILYLGVIQDRSRLMFQTTVFARVLAAVALTVLAFTSGPWQLVLFAVLEALGALWTNRANRRA